MLSETETVYELWEEEPPVFPSHSRLYHLEPIGVGSPMVESLTSYVSRLAEAHGILPRALITDEILPGLSRSHLYHDGYPVYGHLTRFWKQSSVLNGTSKTAASWVQALEHLTLRHDLRFLTMLPWASVLPPRGLLRPMQAWCSTCYQEWRKTKHPIYQPLIWQISVITTCPCHRLPLSHHCPYPNCMYVSPSLIPHAQPGYCSQCGHWLGDTVMSERDKKVQEEENQDRQHWTSAFVGELLATAPHLSTSPPREVIATTITTHVNKVMGGSFSAFARQLGVHRRTVWEWGQGTQIPQLETLLQLCAYFETSPIHFLKGHVLAVTPASKQASEKKPSTEQPRRRFRKFEAAKLQHALEAVLQDQEYPPPSMRETAQRLKYDPSHLYKHFPELCHAIADRYQAYQKEQKLLRIQGVEKEVQQAANALSTQGCFPSERQIGKMLKSRGMLKEHAARIALYNARQQVEKKL